MSSLRGFGFSLDIYSGRTRQWFYRNGEKRWADTGELVECLDAKSSENLDEISTQELTKQPVERDGS